MSVEDLNTTTPAKLSLRCKRNVKRASLDASKREGNKITGTIKGNTAGLHRVPQVRRVFVFAPNLG